MGEQSMADNKTIERTQQEVVSANKDTLYQATLKDTELEKVKAIFKGSNGLDNISERDMQTFRSFMFK
tara:strand:+ start:420 stop:623 length:204 start_codon:yes stop_codon:yes gene_type:complete